MHPLYKSILGIPIAFMFLDCIHQHKGDLPPLSMLRIALGYISSFGISAQFGSDDNIHSDNGITLSGSLVRSH